MVVNVPNYRRLKNQYKFLTENVWEIQVPGRYNVEWSVILSCLFTSSKELSERIKHFARPEENIEKIIEDFNPFRNRFSFSQNDILKNIVKEFKSKIQRNSDNETSVSEVDPKSGLKVLKRASEYLNCNIHLFTKDQHDHIISYEHFSHEATDHILLFKSDQDVVDGFGLPESYCIRLREDALKNVLFRINIKEEDIESIWQTARYNENFLIAILQSDERDVLEMLSDSPFVIRKLTDAGFQVDPVIKDSNGRSAFYHALISGKTNLCISVYHLGIYCCSEDDLSTRKPSRKVIENLMLLRETLHKELTILQEDENFTCLNSLISLRIKVNEKILSILEETRTSNTEDNDNKMFQVAQQRLILLEILNVYSENLYIKPSRSWEISMEELQKYPLEEYVAHKYYFDVIDVDVSLFFFDYIFKLQKNLKLINEYKYATVESIFFILLLCQDIFNRKIKNCDYFKHLEDISAIRPFEIPFTIRKYGLRNIWIFSSDLKSIAIHKEVIRNDVPIQEIYNTLCEYPEIKNYFLIKRLTGYIESALNIIEKTNWKMQSVFILERVLHVTGEFMKLEPDDDFDVKWFVSLYMPKDIRKILHDIRNNLTYFTTEEFAQKINLEKKWSVFKGIEDGIRSIHDFLQPLLNIMIEKNIVHIQQILMGIKEKMNDSETYKQKFEDSIPNIIQSVLDVQNECRLSSSFTNIKKVFENILVHLENHFNEKESEKDLEKLKKMLKPIKYLLELLKNKFELHEQYKKYCKNVEEILEKLDNESLNTPEILIVDCKELLSLVETPATVVRLNSTYYIENFLTLLEPPSYPTNGDKKDLKNFLEAIIKDDIHKRDKLKDSINKSSTMNMEGLSKVRISYLYDKEWKIFLDFYIEKEYEKALYILDKYDPLKKLKDVFAKKMSEEQFAKFCKRLKCSDDDRKTLVGRVSDYLQKSVARNRLSNLSEIRENFTVIIRDDIEKRDKLKRSINNNFTMKKEDLSKLRISYLFEKEWNTFSDFYIEKEHQKAFEILDKCDPLKKLEDCLSRKMSEGRFEKFCERLNCSDDVRKTLVERVFNYLQKNVANNRLLHLLNRIKHLEEILIDNENECLDLWTSENAFLENHIFIRYMEDDNVRIATEMLVLDCMHLLKKKRGQWEKSEGFFEGINLRNVIAHQGIIIQNICEWFDPSDLPKDILRIVIDFSKDKKAIQDILALFEKANEDFEEFAELLKSNTIETNLVNNENVLLERYEKYVELLSE